MADTKPDYAYASLSPLPPHERAYFWKIVMFGYGLAFLAGWINCTFLIATTNVTTHHTGTVTWLGRWWGQSEYLYMFWYWLILGAFIFGGSVIGIVMHDKPFTGSMWYGIFMLIIGIGCFVTLILLDNAGQLFGEQDFGKFEALNFYNNAEMTTAVIISSFVSGLQNAICTNFTDMIVRTTHVTGLSTDLGLAIGRKVAGRRDDCWRIKVLVGILFGFILGCTGATIVYKWDGVGPSALYFPSITYCVLGFLWLYYDCYTQFKG